MKMNSSREEKLKILQKINSIKKQRVPCAVCSKGASHFKYYNVRCCESCKQFFRRVVAKQKDFICAKLYECDVAPDDRCKGCRLDKCLRLGMDPTLVMVEMTEEQRLFNDKLERRRMKLYREVDVVELLVEGQKRQQQQMWKLADGVEEWPTTKAKVSIAAVVDRVDELSLQPPSIPFPLLLEGPAAEDVATLRPLLTLLDNHRHIWNSATELPTQYLHRHARLADFFREPANLLSMPQHFSAKPLSFWDKQLCIEQTDRFGLLTQDKVDLIVRGTLVTMEMAKALPVFQRLDSQDQLNLMRQVGTAALMLLNCHYSISDQTWTRSNGQTAITPYIESKRYGGDQKIRSLVEKMFCATVAEFKRANVEPEEFVLMIALLFTNTAGADLSPTGRQLLYEESVRLSGILLRLVQRQHGHFEGSQRFAQLLHLLGSSFSYGYDVRKLSTYLEFFYLRTDGLVNFPMMMAEILRR